MDAKTVENLRRNPNVSLIQTDRVVRTSAGTQSPATFGIDRIDQRALPLSNSYGYSATGSGVTAYVIDTGIRLTHTEFDVRASGGYTAINDGQGTVDCNGHGTHVAGTIGGRTNGVAKDVRLVSVRVFDCAGSGSTSTVVSGIDWVASHAAKPAVANMSLGGGANSALDTAVSNLIDSGVVAVVAAGNNNADACTASPARVGGAVTVGATTSSDARASYSNYGSCLDLFAPGSDITSAWYTSDTAQAKISGTSMAAPHVSGAAALFLQNNRSATPQAVRDALVSSATTGVVSSAGSGSPNRLVYTGPKQVPTCTALPESYSGSLNSTQVILEPNGTYYYSSASGTHTGCLDGPVGTDFDLQLFKWNSSLADWTIVATSDSSTWHEQINYSGTAGYYLWKVRSFYGSGSFTFNLQRP
jgi:subtilisin family serine protease